MDLLVIPVAFVETLYLILYLHQTLCREQRFLSPAIEIHPLSQTVLGAQLHCWKIQTCAFSHATDLKGVKLAAHSALYAFYDFIKLAFVGYSNDFISCAI
jgi:hypothetical protein